MRYLMLLAMMFTSIANAGWQENLDKQFEGQTNHRDALRTIYLESLDGGDFTVETTANANNAFAMCYSLFDVLGGKDENSRNLRDILGDHHDAFVWGQSEHHGTSLLDLRTNVLVMPRFRSKRDFEDGTDPALLKKMIKTCSAVVGEINRIEDHLQTLE